jgi:sarcosine oxidase subunit gamma
MSTTRLAAAGVTVAQQPPAGRFSLRLREGSLDAADTALGRPLPRRIGETSGGAGGRALRLGPDEWLIEGERPVLPPQVVHALVDISDREVVWRLEGPRVLELLSIGIARDLRGMETGQGCRTAFDSAQVILVREAPDTFTLAAWRSFAPHVADLLAIGQRELACGL